MGTLRAAVLSPQTPTRARYLPDAVVQIHGGVITSLEAWCGQGVDEDLRPGLLLPGFVDTHVHAAQTRIVGAAVGPLLQWLAESTFPEEARLADPDQAAEVARVFCRSLAASGTTLALGWSSVHPTAADALLAEAAGTGQRLIAGPVLMDTDCPAELALAAEPALAALTGLVDRWHGAADGLLEVAVLPRFAPTCTPELMAGAGALAAERDLLVSTHLSENPDEVRVACERHGAPDYLSIYERAGLVHARSLYAHCIHLSASEWDRLTGAGAVVSHCPDSNAFLGSGGMPVAELRSRGTRLAVGTDVAAGRSFRVPHTLSAAFDNALSQGVRLTPAELLWLGTRAGALALGHPEVGAVEAGLEADLVLVDVPPWLGSPEAILRWVLLAHDAPPARRTWVRGREVWRADPVLPWA